MIRFTFYAIALAVASTIAVSANSVGLPPQPIWQTDVDRCTWHWRQGGGLGLWTETCTFNDNIWQVVWDENQEAFMTRSGDAVMGMAVKAFELPQAATIAELSQTLIEAGHLATDAKCEWRAIALRPAPRTMAFYVLTPSDPAALNPTQQGEIPEPLCGPYGVSTHGVRYFITDLRWPDRAVFVDEGQERPLFDPSSITALR